MNCSFCKEETNKTLILRDHNIFLKDGGDVILCKTCFNLYANQMFEELEKRLKL